MRIRVEQSDWNPIIPSMRITVSIGTAEYFIGECLDEMFKHTDAALYRAKAAGRSRVK
jgi:PleD family two-component response regulator